MQDAALAQQRDEEPRREGDAEAGHQVHRHEALRGAERGESARRGRDSGGNGHDANERVLRGGRTNLTTSAPLSATLGSIMAAQQMRARS